jgi:hypothetical protein
MRAPLRILTIIFSILVFTWSFGALWLELIPVWFRLSLLLVYVGLSIAMFCVPKAPRLRFAIWIAINGLVIAWYMTLKPPATQKWSPEFAQMPWSDRVGDQVTIHNVRNFSYRTEMNFTEIWETRKVDLGKLIGADLFLTHWGVPMVAHSIVSFRFADGSYLATSIEARRTVDQQFSAFRGFFRQYEVIYLVADERDVVRVRTNYRQSEEVYLYRTRITPADAQSLFTAYLGWMNSTYVHPEWYNALTRNCSTPETTYLAKAKIGGISRWDWRSILDGSGDKMLYDLGDLESDLLPFDSLKRQAFINPVALKADGAQDFSRRIRAGRVGFPN